MNARQGCISVFTPWHLQAEHNRNKQITRRRLHYKRRALSWYNFFLNLIDIDNSEGQGAGSGARLSHDDTTDSLGAVLDCRAMACHEVFTGEACGLLLSLEQT